MALNKEFTVIFFYSDKPVLFPRCHDQSSSAPISQSPDDEKAMITGINIQEITKKIDIRTLLRKYR